MELRRTLEICIDRADAGGGCAVHARILETNENAHGVLQLGQGGAGLLATDLGRLARQFGQGLGTPGGARGAQAAAAAAQEFGAHLFDALFRGPLAALYTQLNNDPAHALAFWLIVDDPPMAQVPWELLFDRGGRGFLALSAPFARGLSSSRAPLAPPLRAGPLRVLMAAALPAALSGPDVSAEFEQVAAGLGSQSGTGVQLEHLPHATPEGVQNALREAQEKGAPYDVFHIICHGAASPGAAPEDTGGAGRVLLWEDAEGRPVAVTAPALAALLRGQGVQAVFLNACDSAVTAGDLAPSFAHALLGGGMTLMIGMQAPVRVGDAVDFAVDFYAALADGRSADQALLDVRRVAQVRSGGAATSALPVCYTRALPAQLRPAAAPSPAQALPWWRRAWRGAAATAAVLVAVVGGYLTLRDFLCAPPLGTGPLLGGLCALVAPPVTPQPPEVVVVAPTATPAPWLTGDIKIAVAEFSALTPAGAAVADPQGAEMAQRLYAGLQADLGASAAQAGQTGAIIGVDLPPAAVGPITGATLAEQAENASRRAQEINADMLIYGNLKQEPGLASLDASFYLAPSQLTFAEELADFYPLLTIKSTGELDSNAVTRSEMREQLLAQASGVTGMILGIGYYNRQQYGEARDWLAAADSALAASGNAKHAVVQLFLGSVAAQEGDLTLAHQFYASAHARDGRLARALIGRGQTLFLPARNGCTAGETDTPSIEAAIRDYEEARNIASNPLAAITTKANLGLGSAYLCLAMAAAGDQYWEMAQEHLDNVLEDYAAASAGGGGERLRYLAAQAHERLGALAVATASLAGADGADASALIEEAATHFAQAVALSQEPGGQAVVHLWLAWIAALQGRCSAAQQELALARTAFDARRALDSQSLGYQAFLADFNNLYSGLVGPQLAKQCAP